ncbi:MAG: helix-turn-helix domain-containing protein [Pseudomonadota bacterium]
MSIVRCGDLSCQFSQSLGLTGVRSVSHGLTGATSELTASQHRAVVARRSGLRELRLTQVLIVLNERFAEPDFSAQKLAQAAGLSERYVNELLYEAGASFSSRLLELRLRKVVDLLAQADQRKISEIAFACGFNDLSYFNRCFRRRFGLTPTATRAHQS